MRCVAGIRFIHWISRANDASGANITAKIAVSGGTKSMAGAGAGDGWLRNTDNGATWATLPGQQIRLRGQGETAQGHKPGDVLTLKPNQLQMLPP